MNTFPRVSIVVPIHKTMKNGPLFLWRAVQSIMDQTYKNYEIVICQEGSMPVNTNAGIMRSHGELIKILYMDDYFAHPDALKDMVIAFEGNWLICGADNNPNPYWTNDIETGNNKLGSPSALMIRNVGNPLLFDEKLSWLLDCDYYKIMKERYGTPVILNGVHVNIGIHDGQMTHILTDAQKAHEFIYLKEKYA